MDLADNLESPEEHEEEISCPQSPVFLNSAVHRVLVALMCPAECQTVGLVSGRL